MLGRVRSDFRVQTVVELHLRTYKQGKRIKTRAKDNLCTDALYMAGRIPQVLQNMRKNDPLKGALEYTLSLGTKHSICDNVIFGRTNNSKQ